MLHSIMNHSAEVGLVLFVLCFAMIALFAFTRTRKELDDWAHIPLGQSQIPSDSPASEDAR